MALVPLSNRVDLSGGNSGSDRYIPGDGKRTINLFKWSGDKIHLEGGRYIACYGDPGLGGYIRVVIDGDTIAEAERGDGKISFSFDREVGSMKIELNHDSFDTAGFEWDIVYSVVAD